MIHKVGTAGEGVISKEVWCRKMKMLLRVAVCEDEVAQRALLKEKIACFAAQNDVDITCTEFDSASALLDGTNCYDVLFLDIQLERGQSGIALGKKLRDNGYRGVIVIVTAFEQFLPDGYTIEAYRFLKKPARQGQIDEALQGVIKKLAESPCAIAVKCADGVHYLEADDIVMVESYYRLRRIHKLKGSIETREPLSEIFCSLPAGQFAYAQKGYVVNLRHVMKEHHGLLTLRTGAELAITRTKAREFMLAFGRYIRLRGMT